MAARSCCCVPFTVWCRVASHLAWFFLPVAFVLSNVVLGSSSPSPIIPLSHQLQQQQPGPGPFENQRGRQWQQRPFPCTLRLRGGQADTPNGMSEPSEWEIRNMLGAAGPVAKRIPRSLVDAVREGRADLEVISRFVHWHKGLPLSLRWILQVKPFRQRILADDNFLFKLAVEALLACTVQLVAEVQHRGADFFEEFDFALGGIAAVLFSSTVNTLLAAPVAAQTKAQKRESWFSSFLRTCPSNVFQEGVPPFTMLQRITTFLYHMPKLFLTGFSSSFVGYLYITVLLLVRHAFSKIVQGGKWRRRPKTLSDLSKNLCEQDLEPQDRQDLLVQAGLGQLSDVGLVSIGIDPESVPPSEEALSWLKEASARAQESASAQREADAGGGDQGSKGHESQHGVEGGSGEADSAWEMEKVETVKPLRTKSRSFSDIQDLLCLDGEAASARQGGEGGAGEEAGGGVAEAFHIMSGSTAPAALAGDSHGDRAGGGGGLAARKGEDRGEGFGRMEVIAKGMAGLQRDAKSLHVLPSVSQIAALQSASAEQRRHDDAQAASCASPLLSSPPLASPLRSLTRSSTLLAHQISTGRQPVLRRLPGAPKVVLQGGRLRHGLSLMIESPSLIRPSPSLVFLPPSRGEGEGIGLIPWEEVFNVSMVCGLYVALFSNLRGHVVAGIEMRILNKLLMGAREVWRPVGSVILRTCNMYIGSMTLMALLDLLSDDDTTRADALQIQFSHMQSENGCQQWAPNMQSLNYSP